MVLHVKNWALAVLAFATIIFLSWYGGVDFRSRGVDQAYYSGLALVVAIWCHSLGWKINYSAAPRFPRLRRSLWTAGVFIFLIVEGWYGGVNYAARGEAQA